jgi:hypothetical protein
MVKKGSEELKDVCRKTADGTKQICDKMVDGTKAAEFCNKAAEDTTRAFNKVLEVSNHGMRESKNGLIYIYSGAKSGLDKTKEWVKQKVDQCGSSW